MKMVPGPVDVMSRPTSARSEYNNSCSGEGMVTPTKPRRAPSAASSPGICATPDLTGERVKVFVRVRPPHADEAGGALELTEGGKIGKRGLTVHKSAGGIGGGSNELSFEFDDVLPPGATQQEVYRAAVEPIIDDILHGYNGTLMAYGQTGAGKTHTLSSVRPDNLGMMPRAAADIFRRCRSDPLNDYLVTMSYVQIYMELIQDLLEPERASLTLRENESGVYVAGAKEVEVKAMDDCLRLLALGDSNRATAFTAMNAHSSRSHAIVVLTVVKRKKLAPSQQGAQKVKVGKLFIVDLAGSERLKKSGSTGLRASEARAINLSLSTLGMCIAARADGQPHVPFRSSKLTRLLQESLGGNTKTSMIIAVADALDHCDETSQSLTFGTRAMCVKNRPVVNEAMDYKMMHVELLAELDNRDASNFELERQLLERDEEVESLTATLKAEHERLDRMAHDFVSMREQLERNLAAKGREVEAAREAAAAREASARAAAQAAAEAERSSASAQAAARVSELEEQLLQAQQAAEAGGAELRAAVQRVEGLEREVGEARRELEQEREATAAALAEAAAARAAAEVSAARAAEQVEDLEKCVAEMREMLHSRSRPRTAPGRLASMLGGGGGSACAVCGAADGSGSARGQAGKAMQEELRRAKAAQAEGSRFTIDGSSPGSGGQGSKTVRQLESALASAQAEARDKDKRIERLGRQVAALQQAAALSPQNGLGAGGRPAKRSPFSSCFSKPSTAA